MFRSRLCAFDGPPPSLTAGRQRRDSFHIRGRSISNRLIQGAWSGWHGDC
jgi:hypothetical protein